VRLGRRLSQDYHPGTEPATQGKEGGMRIDVKGRNVAVGDDLRERIQKRFEKIERQVSELAQLDVELSEERNPSIRDGCVAEATLHLKGVTLRARSAADNMGSAIHEMSDDLARQVKRHRDKRRGRREAMKASEARPAPSP
jgi:putative sigma-54 modulation protein